MKHKTHGETLAEVRRHMTGNRRAIESSKYAGCVSCRAVFDVKDVVEWQDEWTGPEKQNRVKRWSGQVSALRVTNRRRQFDGAARRPSISTDCEWHHR